MKNPQNITGGFEPRSASVEQLPTPEPFAQLSDAELHRFAVWLSTHTAVGRVALGELIAAFKRAETEAGFIIVKAPTNG